MLFDNIANHEPIIAEVDVRWVEIPVICIGRKVRVSKPLEGPTGAPELVFDPGASSVVYQSVTGGVNVKEVFLRCLDLDVKFSQLDE